MSWREGRLTPSPAQGPVAVGGPLCLSTPGTQDTPGLAFLSQAAGALLPPAGAAH